MREQSPFKSWRVVSSEQKMERLEKLFRYAYIGIADNEVWVSADQIEYLTGFPAQELIDVAQTHGVAKTAMASELELSLFVKGIGQDVEVVNMQALACWAMMDPSNARRRELLVWAVDPIVHVGRQIG